MGLYLLGKLKFNHDSDVPYISVPRLTLAIITFAFVVYMIPGMWGAPLKALSGYLPPQTISSISISMRSSVNEVKSVAGSGGGNAATLTLRKPEIRGYSFDLPHGWRDISITSRHWPVQSSKQAYVH